MLPKEITCNERIDQGSTLIEVNVCQPEWEVPGVWKDQFSCISYTLNITSQESSQEFVKS